MDTVQGRGCATGGWEDVKLDSAFNTIHHADVHV